MQTFTARDGLEIAYDVSDFTDPWTQPDTRLLPQAAMGNSRLGTALGATIPGGKRGHARSRRLTDARGRLPFSLNQLVGDAVELLDLLGCACAHVVGNSAGGYGVQKLAINYPARVRTLAL